MALGRGRITETLLGTDERLSAVLRFLLVEETRCSEGVRGVESLNSAMAHLTSKRLEMV